MKTIADVKIVVLLVCFVAIFFAFLCPFSFSDIDYVTLYLQNRISLQSLVNEFIFKAKYSELYSILDEILKRTNVYEVRIEKIKVGYPLGRDVLEDIYISLDSTNFEKYSYLSVFSGVKVLVSISKYLIAREEVSELVLKNFSRLCFLNNSPELVIDLVKAGKITNVFIFSELIQRLYGFSMFSEIREVYYYLRDKVEFDKEDLLMVGRALGELDDEECLRILSLDHPMFIPLRIEFLIRFGYIDEGIREASSYGVSPKNAKYVFLAFLNVGNFNEARRCLVYISQYGTRSYLSSILELFADGNILGVERKLKELLLDVGVEPDVKNQIGFLLWIINTSESRESMLGEVLFCLNYFNKVRNKKLSSSRVLQKIRTTLPEDF
ncbi:MAG: hypothetical protein ABDH28_00685 [Brevinematia bacterium]